MATATRHLPQNTAMKLNLETFYSVQLTSGGKTYALKTFLEAAAVAAAHDAEIHDNFQRWLNGDQEVSDAIAQSHLEADGFGGCRQTVSVASCWLSGGIDTNDPFSVKAENWDDAIGFNSIQWGNPATARPSVLH